MRNSTFRAGYELLYTPFAESAKRSAKSVIDVAFDCAGKGAGAPLILLLVGLAPSHWFAVVNLAAALTAAGEFFVARRLRAGYVSALEGGLRRQQSGQLEQAVEYSMADFTVAGSMAGLDRSAVLRALGAAQPGRPPAPPPIRLSLPSSSSVPETSCGFAQRCATRPAIRSSSAPSCRSSRETTW